MTEVRDMGYGIKVTVSFTINSLLSLLLKLYNVPFSHNSLVFGLTFGLVVV